MSIHPLPTVRPNTVLVCICFLARLRARTFGEDGRGRNHGGAGAAGVDYYSTPASRL